MSGILRSLLKPPRKALWLLLDITVTSSIVNCTGCGPVPSKGWESCTLQPEFASR